MFWIALSALIMSLTGEGDDTYAFRKILDNQKEAVEDEVHDPGRQKAAVEIVDKTSAAFWKHRERTGKISACLEKADRTYDVSAATYEACLTDLGPAWDAAGKDLIESEREFRSSLTADELLAVRRAAE